MAWHNEVMVDWRVTVVAGLLAGCTAKGREEPPPEPHVEMPRFEVDRTPEKTDDPAGLSEADRQHLKTALERGDEFEFRFIWGPEYSRYSSEIQSMLFRTCKQKVDMQIAVDANRKARIREAILRAGLIDLPQDLSGDGSGGFSVCTPPSSWRFEVSVDGLTKIVDTGSCGDYHADGLEALNNRIFDAFGDNDAWLERPDDGCSYD
jgi:hypothetical protein